MKSQYKKDIEKSWKMTKNEIILISSLLTVFVIGIIVGMICNIEICGECVKAI